MTITEKVVNAAVSAAVKAANRMCNPDMYTFECERPEDRVVTVSETMNSGVIEDRVAYCRDLAEIVCEVLNEHDCYRWHVFADPEFFDAKGDEIECEENHNVSIVRYQIVIGE